MKKGSDYYDTIAYRESHTRCACCHFDGSAVNPLELHHIVSRSLRGSCDNRVYLMLCRSCHSCHHAVSAGDQQLSLGHILWIKADEDGECDIEFLASLRNRKALKEDMAEPDQWIFDARRDNGTSGWWVN